MLELGGRKFWSPVLFWIEYKTLACFALRALFKGKIIVSPKFHPPNSFLAD